MLVALAVRTQRLKDLERAARRRLYRLVSVLARAAPRPLPPVAPTHVPTVHSLPPPACPASETNTHTERARARGANGARCGGQAGLVAGAALAGALLALLLPEPCDASCRGRWAPTPALRTPRAAFAAVALGGRVFAVGGCCPATAAVESAAAEDGGARLGAWRAEASLLKPRARLGVAAVGGGRAGGARGCRPRGRGGSGGAGPRRPGRRVGGARGAPRCPALSTPTPSPSPTSRSPPAWAGARPLCLLARCQPSRPPLPARRGGDARAAGGSRREGGRGGGRQAGRDGRGAAVAGAATSSTRNNFSV